MKELNGDLFDTECDALCITTNGFVKTNGENVMGRGCAREATGYWPSIARLLGTSIKRDGNNTTVLLRDNGVDIVAFPVKPEFRIYLGGRRELVRHMPRKYKMNDKVPGWACYADIHLIKKSAKQLVELADEHGWKKVLLPRPGCGAGELNWADVKPILDEVLDDRFIAITF